MGLFEQPATGAGKKVDMAEWTLWATLFTLGTALALVALYLFYRERFETLSNRISSLEKELELARSHEQANEKNLSKILEVVMEVRGSTESHLENLRHGLDQLRAENYSQQSVDAA